jgi:hypothetical protein
VHDQGLGLPADAWLIASDGSEYAPYTLTLVGFEFERVDLP